MAPIEHFDAPTLKLAVERYRDVLRAHREELNRLNVYPVPDGDTGTNMVLTVESVLKELDGTNTMEEVCRALAHGSLMGARGNSGVILSQILRGLSGSFSTADVVDAACLAEGLASASKTAYEAVMRPVEGTILTVVRETAEAVESFRNGSNGAVLDLLDTARRVAGDSLDRTPELLPVLKEAGVVDAGGRGFVLFLDALLNVVDGRPVPEPELVEAPPAVRAHMEGSDVADLRYEVMFLLDADDEKVPWFKEAWAAIGDSIVVVGGDGLWNCHIHTDDIGAAVEAGIEAGRPRNIRVTDLAEQVEEEQWVREQAGGGEAAPDAEPCETAVVAVAVGPGLQRLFTGLGASKVVAGGQTMNPSTQQILEAVEACPSDAVVILPNNKNIVPVATQVHELTSKRVEVVPTTSVVEGLSALIAYDPSSPLDANIAAITETAARVRTGEVTKAIRDAPSPAGPINEGDWMGLDREGVVAVEASAAEAAVRLVEHLVGDDGELVTIVVGAEADPGETERLKERLALAHPGVEVEVQEGGQPLYPYLIGVE
ncbi:MAG TPA: DAK2 domain-containing protein [Acidimicrobiia bacterium]|nr:DAK2 domain-containing protein [Acidimicrobiia bacterium]